MRKIKSTILVALIAFALIPTTISMIPRASAATPAYTEVNGTLNGANYTIRFPSPLTNWNRVLVVYCHGYSATEPTRPLIKATDGTESWSNGTLSIGSAFAISSFGTGGWAIQKGMNATHELAQFIVSTYKVAKVYLVGVSMGGAVALLLAEKYPRVYSGVMDISGSKNLTERYNRMKDWGATTNDTELAAKIQAVGGKVPPFPITLIAPTANLSTQLQTFRTLCNRYVIDIAAETGGTPENASQGYQKVDPLYHANISIPVISVHGTADAFTPYPSALQYQTAVAAAGKSSLFRLYTVAGAEHADLAVQAEASRHMLELAALSRELRPLLQASAFCDVTLLPGWTWWFFAQSIGNVGTCTYQWYEGTTMLQGQTSMILQVTKNAAGNYTFYCQVSDADGVTINTNTVTLTIM